MEDKEFYFMFQKGFEPENGNYYFNHNFKIKKIEDLQGFDVKNSDELLNSVKHLYENDEDFKKLDKYTQRIILDFRIEYQRMLKKFNKIRNKQIVHERFVLNK